MAQDNKNNEKSQKISPFHYAFYVNDLAETEAFYTEILSAKIGRKSKTWVDFSLFGHQLSAHINPNKISKNEDHTIDWLIEPHVRFEGQSGEQGTFFLFAPSGNALEFKGFTDLNTIFES